MDWSVTRRYANINLADWPRRNKSPNVVGAEARCGTAKSQLGFEPVTSEPKEQVGVFVPS